jgi:hypothetical protein
VVAAIFLALFVALLAAALATPSEYRRLLTLPNSELDKWGDEFETLALQLSNQVRRPGPWSVEFSENQLNGWLAVDLPNKFSTSIPSGTSNLRVRLVDRQLTMYLHFRAAGLTFPVALTTTVANTDQPNEVALTLERAAAGWLPLSTHWWARILSNALQSSGYPAHWRTTGGRPQVIFQLPDSLTRGKATRWELQAVGCESLKLLLNGTTLQNLPNP